MQGWKVTYGGTLGSITSGITRYVCIYRTPREFVETTHPLQLTRNSSYISKQVFHSS